jgi:hypothetical protein
LGLAKSASATPTPTRGKRKRRIALGILAAAIIVPAVIFHDSPVVERFTGKGYDTNPLPTHSFPRPPFDGAEYSVVSQSVSMMSGLPTNYWETEQSLVDYPAKKAKLTIEHATASVIGGTIGTPQTAGPTSDLFVDQQFSYRQGATAADPWTRTPLPPGTGWEETLNGNEIQMYQDVFDPALRAQHPTSVVSETRHEVPVTTYAYGFLFGDFYESAPALFHRMQIMDGNASDDAPVKVTISLDEQMVVRYLDVEVDYESVIDHRARVDVEGVYPYRSTFELISLTPAAPQVVVPTNVVDATAPTTPTTAVAVAP